MTDKQLLGRFIILAQKLCWAADALPYDPDAYNAILDEIHEIAVKHNRRRRRTSWSSIVTIVILLIILAWLIFECARVLIF